MPSSFKDFKNKRASVQTAGVKQLEKCIKSMWSFKAHSAAGFTSGAKLNVKKTFWNVDEAGAKRLGRPVRNPVELAEPEIAKIKSEMVKGVWALVGNQVREAQSVGKVTSPFGPIKKKIRQYSDKIPPIIIDKFSLLPPIKSGTEKRHENLTPLVETGQLRKSVKSVFFRNLPPRLKKR